MNSMDLKVKNNAKTYFAKYTFITFRTLVGLKSL